MSTESIRTDNKDFKTSEDIAPSINGHEKIGSSADDRGSEDKSIIDKDSENFENNKSSHSDIKQSDNEGSTDYESLTEESPKGDLESVSPSSIDMDLKPNKSSPVTSFDHVDSPNISELQSASQNADSYQGEKPS